VETTTDLKRTLELRKVPLLREWILEVLQIMETNNIAIYLLDCCVSSSKTLNPLTPGQEIRGRHQVRYLVPLEVKNLYIFLS
jgi:hypothetical protein